jgi:hypothetical protein
LRTDAACASLPCVFTLSKSRRTFVLRSVSPSGVTAFSFSPHPVVSGRPAYIRAPGAPSTSFFAAPRFFRSTRRRRSPPPISFPVSADRSVQRGRFFTSAPARCQPLFLRRRSFFSDKRRRSPPLYFPPPRRILRRVSGAGLLPRRRRAVNLFFCAAEVFSATNGEDHLRFTSR